MSTHLKDKQGGNGQGVIFVPYIGDWRGECLFLLPQIVTGDS